MSRFHTSLKTSQSPMGNIAIPSDVFLEPISFLHGSEPRDNPARQVAFSLCVLTSCGCCDKLPHTR